MFTRFPATALIMANALMFTTAPEALAETCVAENSVFNMPLLLFVALIGATVGGKALANSCKLDSNQVVTNLD